MASGARRTFSGRSVLGFFFGIFLFSSQAAQAQERNLAPGFSSLARGSHVVLMPVDVELFELSAGGVSEPKADWTEAANKNLRTALIEKKRALGLATSELNDNDADELAEVNALHAAVARAIEVHHFGPANLRLPTKDGKMDWSMGESIAPIREKTGADYALFVWMRDSYTSAGRAIAMVAFAALGVGVRGGSQIGYASLVDLHTGRVVWFNRLARGTGDLREPEKAKESVNALLSNFPAVP